MAHFAQLDELNQVVQVIAVNNFDILDEDGNESEEIGIAFCTNLLGGTWIQASYNANFRGCYPGLGYKYDPETDTFVVPLYNTSVIQ